MVSSFEHISLICWLFSVQREIPCLVKHVGFKELLIRKTRAASSGWRGEFLLGLFFFLPSPFFLLFSPSSFTPTTSPRFSVIVQFPRCPYVHSSFCHITHSDSWFRKCSLHKMTFLNYP